MKKILMTGLFLFISNFIKRGAPYREAAVDLTKLKIAMGYVQSVKVLRLLFVSLLTSGVCLVLLFTGLILVHGTILLYAPWDIATRMTVTLLCGAAYILGAVGLVMSIFAEDQWLKMFSADKMVEELTGSTNGHVQSRQDDVRQSAAL